MRDCGGWWLSSDIPRQGTVANCAGSAAYLRSVQRKTPRFRHGANTRPGREAGRAGRNHSEISSAGMKHQSLRSGKVYRYTRPIRVRPASGDPRTSRTVRADCIANQCTGKTSLGRVMLAPCSGADKSAFERAGCL